MMSMPLSLTFVFVGEAHLARTAAEQRLERLLEVLVDGFERLRESVLREFVDLLNRLLGVADRIEQILPLRGQEVVPLLRLLELLQRRRIHRAQVFDLRPGLLVSCSAACSTSVETYPPASSSSATATFSSLRLVSSRNCSSDCRRVSSTSISRPPRMRRLRSARAVRAESHPPRPASRDAALPARRVRARTARPPRSVRSSAVSFAIELDVFAQNARARSRPSAALLRAICRRRLDISRN